MTIVLCGGGSGGHITPLLAVASELRKRHKNIKLVYIGERGGKFQHIAENSKLFDELHYISAGKLRRYNGESLFVKAFDLPTIFLNIRDVFKLGFGLIQSYRLLRKLKPNSLFLKGGFVCVPVALAASRLKLPYITHDSDALPGLSNRIAAKWAKYHATAMPAQYYSYPKETVRAVGVPTDERFREYTDAEKSILRAKYGIPEDAKIVLITGGSNGARRLNEAILDILPKLMELQPKLYGLHQIGSGNEDQIKNFPKNLSERISFFDFTSELFHMSAIADVIITRAGASAVADFAAQGKACVIVPNPLLTGGHQLKNAQVYADAQAALIVQEATIANSTDALFNSINELLNSPEMRTTLGQNLKNLTPKTNTAAAISDLLEEVAL